MNNLLKKIIPLYIFDEHKDALWFWQRAKYEDYIQEPLDLFHIDAHSDTGLPRTLTKSIYSPDNSKEESLEYYKNLLEDELNITNFILPAVLLGLVKNVYFIYPGWRKLKQIKKKMNISSAFGEGKVLKFEMDLKNIPKSKVVFKALPDLKYFNYHACRIEKIPKNREVILDIDLDYFACRDSVSNNLSYELEITQKQFLEKEIFWDNKTLPFSGLDFSFQEKDKRYYCRIAFKKVKDVSYLPTKEEIKSEMDTLVATLQVKKIIPTVITISRSCISGYCPDDYYEFIELELKQKLKASFDTNIVI